MALTENRNALAAPNSRSNSLTKLENASVRRAYTDRMTLSEAIDAVGKMISGYPNGKVDKSYIGTMAALLCQYPRMIAAVCADPIRGVARETKFIPTVADVVKWCEIDMERMTRIVDFEDRTAQQLRERAEFEQQQKEETPELRTAAVERVRLAMAAAGMPLEGDRQLAHGETPETVMKRFNLTDEQWAAIPDAEPGHWEKLQARHRGAE